MNQYADDATLTSVHVKYTFYSGIELSDKVSMETHQNMNNVFGLIGI